MIKNITNEISTYMNFCGGIEARQTNYPPDVLIRTIFHSKYYKYLEDTMNGYKQEQRMFMSLIFRQIIPFICSILPNTVNVLYRDDMYDPNIYIQKDYQDVGTISLSKYRFEYRENDAVKEKRDSLASLKEQADSLEWQLQREMETSDVTSLIGRKRKIRMRDAYLKDLGAQLEMFRQQQMKEQMELEDLLSAEKEKSDLIRKISDALWESLRMPTEIITEKKEEESYAV